MSEKKFENELPTNYKEVYSIDAKNKKVGIMMNLGAFVLMIPFMAFFFTKLQFSQLVDEFNLVKFYLIFIFGVIIYMILHELTHGIAYKALTKHKLTFGLSWSCAYCGVPDLYVYRKVCLISLLAPFTVFTIILFPLTMYFLSKDSTLYSAFALIFSTHFGGCIGDLFDTYLLLTKYKSEKLLIRDTGPAQYFYLPEDEI